MDSVSEGPDAVPECVPTYKASTWRNVPIGTDTNWQYGWQEKVQRLLSEIQRFLCNRLKPWRTYWWGPYMSVCNANRESLKHISMNKWTWQSSLYSIIPPVCWAPALSSPNNFRSHLHIFNNSKKKIGWCVCVNSKYICMEQTHRFWDPR